MDFDKKDRSRTIGKVEGSVVRKKLKRKIWKQRLYASWSEEGGIHSLDLGKPFISYYEMR